MSISVTWIIVHKLTSIRIKASSARGWEGIAGGGDEVGVEAKNCWSKVNPGCRGGREERRQCLHENGR
jgi:hypothetical protein